MSILSRPLLWRPRNSGRVTHTHIQCQQRMKKGVWMKRPQIKRKSISFPSWSFWIWALYGCACRVVRSFLTLLPLSACHFISKVHFAISRKQRFRRKRLFGPDSGRPPTSTSLTLKSRWAQGIDERPEKLFGQNLTKIVRKPFISKPKSRFIQVSFTAHKVFFSWCTSRTFPREHNDGIYCLSQLFSPPVFLPRNSLMSKNALLKCIPD